MIIPIRCFTCNKPIAHLWIDYEKMLQTEYDKIDDFDKYQNKLDSEEKQSIESKILDELKINRYCCRRMFLGHVDLCEKI